MVYDRSTVLRKFQKIMFIYSIRKNNNFIIINGYNNYVFVLTFLFNFFSVKRKYLAIESDTQLKIPKNIIKSIIKYLYLSLVFKNQYTLGFAGGSKTHKDLFRYYGMKEERIFMMPMIVDNNKYYDFTMVGIGANVLGYCDKDVIRASKYAISSGNLTTLNPPEDIEGDPVNNPTLKPKLPEREGVLPPK